MPVDVGGESIIFFKSIFFYYYSCAMLSEQIRLDSMIGELINRT